MRRHCGGIIDILHVRRRHRHGRIRINERIDYLRPDFVEAFPDELLPGALCISIEYCTAGHLCACGCGSEVITPLDPHQWFFSYDGRDITLTPSVGNWALPCRSHYLVSHGRIIWARRYTSSQIEAAQHVDRVALGIENPGQTIKTPRVSWWHRLSHRKRA